MRKIDDVAQDAQTEDKFLQIEEAVASLVQRFNTLDFGNLPRNHHLIRHLVEEVSNDNSATHPSVDDHQLRERSKGVMANKHDS